MKKAYIIPNMECAPLRAIGVIMTSPGGGQEGGTGETPGGSGDPSTPGSGQYGLPRKPF